MHRASLPLTEGSAPAFHGILHDTSRTSYTQIQITDALNQPRKQRHTITSLPAISKVIDEVGNFRITHIAFLMIRGYSASLIYDSTRHG